MPVDDVVEGIIFFGIQRSIFINDELSKHIQAQYVTKMYIQLINESKVHIVYVVWI